MSTMTAGSGSSNAEDISSAYSRVSNRLNLLISLSDMVLVSRWVEISLMGWIVLSVGLITARLL